MTSGNTDRNLELEIGQSVEHNLTPSIQGMINAVADMVKVEEI